MTPAQRAAAEADKLRKVAELPAIIAELADLRQQVRIMQIERETK